MIASGWKPILGERGVLPFSARSLFAPLPLASYCSLSAQQSPKGCDKQGRKGEERKRNNHGNGAPCWVLADGQTGIPGGPGTWSELTFALGHVQDFSCVPLSWLSHIRYYSDRWLSTPTPPPGILRTPPASFCEVSPLQTTLLDRSQEEPLLAPCPREPRGAWRHIADPEKSPLLTSHRSYLDSWVRSQFSVFLDYENAFQSLPVASFKALSAGLEDGG